VFITELNLRRLHYSTQQLAQGSEDPRGGREAIT
jgi:hypothetical protein